MHIGASNADWGTRTDWSGAGRRLHVGRPQQFGCATPSRASGAPIRTGSVYCTTPCTALITAKSNTDSA